MSAPRLSQESNRHRCLGWWKSITKSSTTSIARFSVAVWPTVNKPRAGRTVAWYAILEIVERNSVYAGQPHRLPYVGALVSRDKK